MTTTRITTLLALALAPTVGCVADPIDFGASEDEIFVAAGTQLWQGAGGRGTLAVEYCFEPPSGTLPTAGFGREHALGLAYLRRSWQAISGARLVDRGACPTTGSEQLVRVRHRGWEVTAPGAQSGGSVKTTGMAVRMPPATGDDTMSMAIDLPVRWNPTAQRWETLGSDDRLGYTWVHEFGHVLGFDHEQDHTNDPHALQCRNQGAATAGTSVTTYDRDSVMNYCQAGGNWTPALTALDVQGVRRLYGWRDATDYDNDARSNLAVWRPSGTHAGHWFVDGGPWAVPYGEPGDVPIADDLDGDGASDLAVWRPSGPYQGTWFVRKSGGGEERVQWGATGDLPATGDLDGDGRAELVVYRPSARTFYVRRPDGTSWSLGPWGEAGDVPVLADYDGDGRTDLALYRPTGVWAGSWFVIASTNPGYYTHHVWGVAGDVPVVGDFDGDRKADRAVWRPGNGTWYVQASGGGVIQRAFGEAGDVPLSLDHDGDAITELSVWRPSLGRFYVARTDGTWLAVVNLGQQGDVPLGRTIR